MIAQFTVEFGINSTSNALNSVKQIPNSVLLPIPTLDCKGLTIHTVGSYPPEHIWTGSINFEQLKLLDK